jgi:hypothetical protein
MLACEEHRMHYAEMRPEGRVDRGIPEVLTLASIEHLGTWTA